MPQPKHTRRWFQFSLRTMFALMTLVALWLASELATIRERRQMRERIHADFGTVINVSEARELGLSLEKQSVSVPFWRRWLGDEAVAEVDLAFGSLDEKVTAAQKMFPEAVEVLIADPFPTVPLN
ncbi:MAG TPA: hypothetical protein VGN12_19920 [Pirellulales bacterium]|jgi:hypothetical protein